MGDARLRRGAKARLAVLLCVARHLVAWRGGLRLEELAATTGIPEGTLWPYLVWAKRERVLVDCGDRGFFIDTEDGPGPGSGSVGELGKDHRAA